MNTPNPLIPQGTLPDSRGKSRFHLAVLTIIAAHVVMLGGLLIAGCKKDEAPRTDAQLTNDLYVPPVLFAQTNAVPVAVVATNPPPVDLAPPVPHDTVVAEGAKEHTIIKGDSFFTLAKKYGVTIKAIGAANPGVDSSRLKIGQKIQIPGKPAGAAVAAPGNGAAAVVAGGDKTYTVKSGDTLARIAKNNGTTAKAIKALNALKTDQIKVGQKLKIPEKTAPEPAVPSVAAPAAAPLPGTPQ